MAKKLFIGNLPYSAEEGQLQVLFGNDGRQVVSVRILTDRETGRSRGFGFVEMGSEDDAQRAIEALNGHDFMGRPLTVNEAREGGGGGGGRGGRSFR
jgi:RNA recognition motif-containing protein